MLTDGVWNPTRYSIFYVSRVDGVLDAWDLLQQQSEPILSIKVCDESLKCLRAHEAGYLVGAGSTKGATFLLEMSDNMTSIKNDKPLLTAVRILCSKNASKISTNIYSRCWNVRTVAKRSWRRNRVK